MSEARRFHGEFETHLTVRLEELARHDESASHDRAAWDILNDWARDHGWKVLHIVLDRGAASSQPMLTGRSFGDLTGRLAAAQQAADELRRAGFQVVRMKLEVASDHADTPMSDAEARWAGERYFEHHLKLRLPSDADTTPLAELAMRHGAHLSRNALRRRDDGRTERFVTQRCRNVGRAGAAARLAVLASRLHDAGWETIETEAEYVVVDSNLALDDGWLPGEERRNV